MAQASSALSSARTYLNDDDATNWTDPKLFPKLQEAYRKLQNELITAEIPIFNAVTAVITVPALLVDDANLDLSTVAGYPTNMIEPIWMKERAVGQTNMDFVDMTQVDFIPNINKTTQLIWWSWTGGTIILLGALNPVQIQLRYKGGLTIPQQYTDNLVVTLAETYLGPETAAIALDSLGKDSTSIRAIAERNLDNVVRLAIKGLQNLPSKRRPYHRGRGRSRVLRDF